MSVAAEETRRRSNGAGAQPDGLPDASMADSVRVVLVGLLPSVLRGLFSPRPRAMKLLTTLRTDERMARRLGAIRREHPGQGVGLLGGRIIVLWGPAAIKEVLDHSADVYASDSGAKAKGMCHFQPGALTLSRGEDWRDRRAFNESVLATSERVHPLAERFLAVVDDEVTRLRIGPNLEWQDFEALFDHITLRVIFGDASRGERELTERLEKLMGEANRLVGLNESDNYYEFYGALERKLRDPEPGSLLSRYADAPQSDRTRVAHQIPHWIFAMRDTLGANVYRALALIVSQPEAEKRVREELEDADLTDPAAVDGLRYLEGCFQEAMRLWPTLPLLARETTRDTTLAGRKVDEGTQVMMLNAFNHRDPDQPETNRLEPERWADGERDYRFNHLSNGTQDCPGGSLVLLLGKAVLARMLEEYKLDLLEPKLPPGGELPHMLDFFAIRFGAELSFDGG
jgi:cytochrome P450